MTTPDIDAIVHRLDRIHERLEGLRRRGATVQALAGKLSPIKATPYDMKKHSISRLEGVEDAASGLRYAAWCIGETLFACGGAVLMDAVYTEYEKRFGTRASAWLDHRWNGVGHWVS